MRYALAAFPLAMLISLSAFAASDMQVLQVAQNVGDLLASEEACKLTYDQAAIEQFIESKVPADDMSFTGTLNMMVVGTKSQIGEMTPSAKTAHCAQIRRVAKQYGFTQ